MPKIVTFGEIMLRLKSPNSEKFFQTPSFEATFGGGEANVAVSLSHFGKSTSFVSIVPNNPIGQSAIAELRKHGVDTSFIKQESGRLGIYFLENGACQRSSVVVYDREHSCISKVNPVDFDFEKIFVDATLFHVTGITPAISQSAADTTLQALKIARKVGCTVSIDLNYRKKLWNYGKKPIEIMRELVSYADVLIANEEDIEYALDICGNTGCVTSGSLNIDGYKDVINDVRDMFPNISTIAITLRESVSADSNNFSAILADNSGVYLSKKYEINDIVDRVGGGDAFSAGLIYGLHEFPNEKQRILDFAVSASCLKHSITGDFNLVSVKEVESLMQGDGSGRVQR